VITVGDIALLITLGLAVLAGILLGACWQAVLFADRIARLEDRIIELEHTVDRMTFDFPPPPPPPAVPAPVLRLSGVAA